MKEMDVINYDELIRILKNTDSSTPLKASVLEELLGYSEKESNHNKIVRNAIKKLTDAGLVIGSNNRGYFTIKTPEELRRYVQILNNSIAGLKIRKRSVISAWKKSNPNRYILKVVKETKS